MLKTYPTISYEGLEKRKKYAFKKMVSCIKEGLTVEEMTASKWYKKIVRKMRKAEYIEKNYRNFEFKSRQMKPKYLMNYFTVETSYEYWTNIYIFKTGDIDKVLNDLDIMDIEVDGSNWSSPYDCTGRTFFRSCEFIVLSDRIIVKQNGALDV